MIDIYAINIPYRKDGYYISNRSIFYIVIINIAKIACQCYCISPPLHIATITYCHNRISPQSHITTIAIATNAYLCDWYHYDRISPQLRITAIAYYRDWYCHDQYCTSSSLRQASRVKYSAPSALRQTPCPKHFQQNVPYQVPPSQNVLRQTRPTKHPH